MTIEATMQLEFEINSYLLTVKMIKIDGIYYFFIRDMENVGGLLSGKTLELTFDNVFYLSENGKRISESTFPEAVVLAIQNEIMLNRNNWFY